MNPINRRRILKSLAGGAAVAHIPHAISNEALAAPVSDAPLGRTEGHYYWMLAQQGGLMPRQHALDFWSMSCGAVHYENYLPPQIARALIAYGDFPRPFDSTKEALDAFIEVSKFYNRDWLDPGMIDRFSVEPAIGSKDFRSVLTSFVGEKGGTSARSALLALDSTSFGPGWHTMGSAFGSCYNSIVGLTHIFSERGFAQEKRYSRTSSASDFVRAFLRDTSPCDTVIVTSSGLFETDAGLSPGASAEELVGELVRRLSYALLQPEILDRLAGAGGANRPKPRYFALGSATLNARSEPLLHLQAMLDRQSAFVSASFAPLAIDQIPLFIATSRDDDLEQRTGLMDVLTWAASISGYARNRDCFATVQAPCYQPEARRPGWLDMIALWPFEVSA
jgi:hypothetical protein